MSILLAFWGIFYVSYIYCELLFRLATSAVFLFSARGCVWLVATSTRLCLTTDTLRLLWPISVATPTLTESGVGLYSSCCSSIKSSRLLCIALWPSTIVLPAIASSFGCITLLRLRMLRLRPEECRVVEGFGFDLTVVRRAPTPLVVVAFLGSIRWRGPSRKLCG